MPNPIGITFIPSDENQAEGPKRGALEGPGGSDLAQAFRVLNLRLPQVLGARSLAPKRLLTGQGSRGIPGAFNPQTAVFEALLNAMSGGGGSGSLASLYGDTGGGGGGGSDQAPVGGGLRVIAGERGHGDEPFSGDVISEPSWQPSLSGRLDDIYSGDRLSGRRRV